MNECICNTCKNLRSAIGEEGEIGESTCEFGFPSDSCIDCTGTECSQTCHHYELDDENAVPLTVKCAKCGKELQKVFNDGDFGDVYCIDCYLNQ